MTTTSAGTNGFLFCDLRGYTAFVERHGDQAAAELLATYRELVRRAIASHAGAEIKTEGDSVYVVFPAASAAVEAGLEIVAAAGTASTKERPIRVGVGVHAGETVATTEGLVGGAVNIAARVCAKAQAGEVLVTDTVRALTRTYLPYRYTSLGHQQLKGIAGGIPLFRVEAVASSGRARLARQLRARRGRVLVPAGLVVVALVAAAGVYAVNRPTDCLSLAATTKDVVAKIDPARNCVVALYEVGHRPTGIVATLDRIWVANVDDWTLTLTDPASRSSFTTGTGGAPVGIAADAAGNAYVLLRDDRTLGPATFAGETRAAVVDIGTRRVRETRLLPQIAGGSSLAAPGYESIAFSGSQAWVSNRSGDILIMRFGSGWQIKNVEAQGAAAGALGAIASGSGAIWIGNASSPFAYRLDGASAKPTKVSLDLHGGVTAMAVTEGAVWLGRQDGDLSRYDSGTGLLQTFPVGGGATSVAAGSGEIWVADDVGGVVRRIDPRIGSVIAVIRVGGRPAGLAIAPDGSVWVTIQGS